MTTNAKQLRRHQIVLWLALSIANLPLIGIAYGIPSKTDLLPSKAPELESLTAAMLKAGVMQNARLGGILRDIVAGKNDVAIEKAKAYLSEFPLSSPGEELLGTALVSSGKLDDGLSHLRRSVELNPKQATAITKIGDVFAAQKKADQAKTQYLEAVVVDPDNRHAHQRLGLIFEEAGDLALARSHFESGIKGTPAGYIGIKSNLGRIYNRNRQYQKTIELLHPSITEKSQNTTAQLILGVAWLGTGQSERAIPLLEAVRNSDFPKEKVYLALAIAYREAGNIDEAFAAIEKSLELKPNWSPALYHLAETLVAAGSVERGIEHYQLATKDAEDKNLIRHRMAEVYAQTGKPEKAIEIYRELISSGEGDIRSYLQFGARLQVSGNFEEAEKILAAACQRYPDNPTVHFKLGMQHALTKDYARALEHLETAKKLSAWDPRVRKAISLARLRRGEIELALQEAEELVKLVPQSTGDQFYLGTLLEQTGAEKKAIDRYQEVLKLDPDHAAALNNLAQIHLKAGRFKESLPLAQRAAAAGPKIAAIQDTLGWASFQEGAYPQARAALEQAVKLSEGKQDYRYRLAVVYSKLKLNDEATEQLQKALQIGSEFKNRQAAEQLASKLATQ